MMKASSLLLFCLFTVLFVLLFQVMSHNSDLSTETKVVQEPLDIISNETDTYYITNKLDTLYALKDNLSNLRNELYEKPLDKLLNIQSRIMDPSQGLSFRVSIDTSSSSPLENKLHIDVPVGPQGPPGLPGEEGLQGDKGEEGERGEEGNCGPVVRL